jgi:hypothetical protein
VSGGIVPSLGPLGSKGGKAFSRISCPAAFHSFLHLKFPNIFGRNCIEISPYRTVCITSFLSPTNLAKFASSAKKCVPHVLSCSAPAFCLPVLLICCVLLSPVLFTVLFCVLFCFVPFVLFSSLLFSSLLSCLSLFWFFLFCTVILLLYYFLP